MIYITGDCHGDFTRFNMRNFPEQKEMTKQDLILICGDFGGIWKIDGENKQEKWWLDWLEEKSFTTLFIDGNHENFDRLYKYHVETWHGGKVHKIRTSVIHLMRGQVFKLHGKTFFTFGGASSHDIEDGILDPLDSHFREKKKKMERKRKRFRIRGISWWKQELPSFEEMEEGRKNLCQHYNQIDYIITHCCAADTLELLNLKLYRQDVLTGYLEEIKKSVQFQKWFFGHYHDTKRVNEKETLIYKDLIRIL